jgi:NAD(P)H-quinone oxidoreductase subunit 5
MIFVPRMPGRTAEAGLWGLVALATGALAWTSVTASAATGLGVQVDRLTATLTLLVALVGAVTFRFARRYLLGESGQVRFLAWHAMAVVSAMLLMLSSNLILLWAAWTCTSLALHKLLTHYAHRPEAWPPARKKFLISRLGDIALMSAILIIAVTYGTTELPVVIAEALANRESTAVHAVSVLVVLAALTKSAQFPFHSWLPETMEAPTPVSALMHAGIINAGGALVLKFSPIVAASPISLVLLVGVGISTAILGMLSMWAQTNVKRTLAWSTVSQMGFMMIQLGLGVFPAAVLHIVGHGFYKAWNFLACGWVPERSPCKPLSPARHLVLVGIGTWAAAVVIVMAARLLGLDLLQHPGEATLFAVLALAIGQAWPIVLASMSARRVASASVFTAAAAVLAVTLQQGAAVFFAPVLTIPMPPSGLFGWTLGAVVVIATVALVITHAMLPYLSRATAGRAFRTHALHGFYCGAVADWIVRALSRSPLTTGGRFRA